MLLVCVATKLEGEILAASGEIDPLVTGIGPVNAAHALTLAVARARPERIVVCGVGGAYPGSGLEVLDVTCASSETSAAIGIASPPALVIEETTSSAASRETR